MPPGSRTLATQKPAANELISYGPSGIKSKRVGLRSTFRPFYWPEGRRRSPIAAKTRVSTRRNRIANLNVPSVTLGYPDDPTYYGDFTPVVRCNYNECIFCQSWSSTVGRPGREPLSPYYDNEKIKHFFFRTFRRHSMTVFFFESLTGNYEIIPACRAACLYVKLFETFSPPKSGYGKKNIKN